MPPHKCCSLALWWHFPLHVCIKLADLKAKLCRCFNYTICNPLCVMFSLTVNFHCEWQQTAQSLFFEELFTTCQIVVILFIIIYHYFVTIQCSYLKCLLAKKQKNKFKISSYLIYRVTCISGSAGEKLCPAPQRSIIWVAHPWTW